jgi:hypothetical protein
MRASHVNAARISCLRCAQGCGHIGLLLYTFAEVQTSWNPFSQVYYNLWYFEFKGTKHNSVGPLTDYNLTLSIIDLTYFPAQNFHVMYCIPQHRHYWWISRKAVNDHKYVAWEEPLSIISGSTYVIKVQNIFLYFSSGRYFIYVDDGYMRRLCKPSINLKYEGRGRNYIRTFISSMAFWLKRYYLCAQTSLFTDLVGNKWRGCTSHPLPIRVDRHRFPFRVWRQNKL